MDSSKYYYKYYYFADKDNSKAIKALFNNDYSMVYICGVTSSSSSKPQNSIIAFDILNGYQ